MSQKEFQSFSYKVFFVLFQNVHTDINKDESTAGKNDPVGLLTEEFVILNSIKCRGIFVNVTFIFFISVGSKCITIFVSITINDTVFDSRMPTLILVIYSVGRPIQPAGCNG